MLAAIRLSNLHRASICEDCFGETAWNDVIQQATSELAEFLEACGDSSMTDDDRGVTLDVPRNS